MKVHILWGMIFFVSVTALGQNNGQRGPWGPSPTRFDDPFETMEIYMNSTSANWPAAHPIGNTSDGRSTVSLKELEHKVPKPAAKEFEKGLKALKKGDSSLAKEHFQNAVNIDPQFADAHNDLGVMIARAGKYEPAIVEFQKAIDISGKHIEALTNLSVALYAEGKYHEVCQVGRQSLKVDPNLLEVRLVLGLSLIADHGDMKEALDDLDRAARAYPQAHLAASNLLLKSGRRDEATQHLEAYLRSAAKDDPSKPQVEAQLAQLRQ